MFLIALVHLVPEEIADAARCDAAPMLLDQHLSVSMQQFSKNRSPISAYRRRMWSLRKHLPGVGNQEKALDHGQKKERILSLPLITDTLADRWYLMSNIAIDGQQQME